MPVHHPEGAYHCSDRCLVLFQELVTDHHSDDYLHLDPLVALHVEAVLAAVEQEAALLAVEVVLHWALARSFFVLLLPQVSGFHEFLCVAAQ